MVQHSGQLSLDLGGDFRPPAATQKIVSAEDNATLIVELKDNTHRHLLGLIRELEENPDEKSRVRFRYQGNLYPYQDIVFDLTKEEAAGRLKEYIHQSMKKMDAPQPIIITPPYIGVDPIKENAAYVHRCETQNYQTGKDSYRVIVDFAMPSIWQLAVPFQSQMIMQGRPHMQEAMDHPEDMRFTIAVHSLAIALWQPPVIGVPRNESAFPALTS